MGGHTARVTCATVVLSRVFTGSEDGTVRQWQLQVLRHECICIVEEVVV